jgi:hypothetical protein
MNKRLLWSRVLMIIGTVALLIGALDPLEGAFVILPASAVIALSALLAGSRYRRLACWAFGSTAIGIGALFIISALEGVGGGPAGDSGRSMWWLLTCLPYPVGWILCLYAGARMLIESNRARKPSQSTLS